MSKYKEVEKTLPGYRNWECKDCKGRVQVDARTLPPARCPHCGRRK